MQPVEPRRVLYSYYTAGSGGVGPTILETSLLLAGTPVTVYANGEKVPSNNTSPHALQPLTCSNLCSPCSNRCPTGTTHSACAP